MVLGLLRRDGPPLIDADRAAVYGTVSGDRSSHESTYAVLIANEAAVHRTPAGAAFIFEGRIFNRSELIDVLRPVEGRRIGDAALAALAYGHFGNAAPQRLIGDWCFVAYDPVHRELFLARDHYGQTSVYYAVSPSHFAFSTSRRVLLDLKLFPVRMDQLYLGQVLMSWPAYHGERTVHQPILRLPPAHLLTVSAKGVRRSCYCRLEEVSERRFAKRLDYIDGFLSVFDRAVRECLPVEGGAAVTLSGGLDSGSVAVTAAKLMGSQHRLDAYTSVPLLSTAPYITAETRFFGDEYPLACATAASCANIEVRPVSAEGASPIQTIRDALPILMEPQHAAGNLFWMFEIFRLAKAQGHGVLLTGQMGNAGISWTGDIFSQPLAYQIRQLGLGPWLKRRAKQLSPSMAVRIVRRLKDSEWRARTALAADFAQHLGLREGKLHAESAAAYRSPRLERQHILKPGRSNLGSFYSAIGTSIGLAITDPTADPRVLEYCLSVPDHIFIDPKTGDDRWLIREAMKGRLPDEVRLNRRRGRQSADLVPRLRASRDEVEAALDECAHGPAATYLDVAHMRRVWDRIQREDNSEVFQLSIAVLTRGIMAGLFVNGFGKTW
jgi:asparagine synthase (glutamine-hydrolysing)